MKKSILFLSAATLMVAASCQNFKKGDGGLEYKIVKDAGAEKAVAGDLLSVDMTIKSDRKDSLLTSTYEMGLPQIINIAPDSIPGMYAGDYNSMFKFLGEGDSAVFRLNLDTMEAKIGQPKPDIADKFVTFTIKVRKHFKKGELTDSALYAEVDSYFQAELESLKNAEEGKLSRYVSSKKLEPTKTATGLQYIIDSEGEGEKASVGDTVVVNYTGQLTDGTMFDTTDEGLAKKNNLSNPYRTYEPIRFSLGNDPVIQGWTEGLQLLSKGGKAKFIVPSSLAYYDRPPQGSKIPVYAPLVFDVELVDIIKPQATEEVPSLPPA
ncbi:MAG TPA: FKBP-type peptidyl-prolyl cis-trans isomerase, partial [Sphingobacterium sp.]|nr:FKBP-type peptidyl-prolyl cis-trans isomerase [Sphingobacterium sp.]